MKASILDLRYKMKDILKALARNETVSVYYHGSLKGKLIPYHEKETGRIKDHAFFGMSKSVDESVEKTMQKLRGGRFNDL